jgi:uncharacterized membrane protein
MPAVEPTFSWKDVIEASVASLIIETFLYVVYLATLAYGLRWLVYDDEGKSVRKQIDWLMLSVTIVAFLLTTISLAMGGFLWAFSVLAGWGPYSKTETIAITALGGIVRLLD